MKKDFCAHSPIISSCYNYKVKVTIIQVFYTEKRTEDFSDRFLWVFYWFLSGFVPLRSCFFISMTRTGSMGVLGCGSVFKSKGRSLMATAYSEVPDNYDILKPFLLTEFSDYKTIIDNADIVVFYDTCAIQHHANLDLINQQRLIDYLTNKKTVILITKCVLMELGGDNHLIHKNVIRYFKFLIEKGVKIILFEESMVYCFLSEVYQSASKINEILRYAVREFSIPTSIIRETVRNDPKLTALIGDNNISSNNNINI